MSLWFDTNRVISTLWSESEISNEYSKRWVKFNFILIISNILRVHTYFNIMEPLLIFKVWITHHTHTSQHIWWILLTLQCCSTFHNSTYPRSTKICMNRVWTLKFSLRGCMFALLAVLCLICLGVRFFFSRTLFLTESKKSHDKV